MVILVDMILVVGVVIVVLGVVGSVYVAAETRRGTVIVDGTL